MAGGQDLFDAIVMADDRWVAGFGRGRDPGPVGSALAGWATPAARACCPTGAGPGQRFVALKAVDTCGAEALSIFLYSWATGPCATCPAAPPDPPPPSGAAPSIWSAS